MPSARWLATLKRYAPRVVAVLGVTAYRAAFGQSRAALGLQPEPMGATVVWVLPNPSGLNAHFQIDDLAKLFREVKDFSSASRILERSEDAAVSSRRPPVGGIAGDEADATDSDVSVFHP